MTLRTLNYGNYGIFLLIMGNAGFCPSTVFYTISMRRDSDAYIPKLQAEAVTSYSSAPSSCCGVTIHKLGS